MIEQTWPIFDDDDSGEVSSTAGGLLHHLSGVCCLI